MIYIGIVPSYYEVIHWVWLWHISYTIHKISEGVLGMSLSLIFKLKLSAYMILFTHFHIRLINCVRLCRVSILNSSCVSQSKICWSAIKTKIDPLPVVEGMAIEFNCSSFYPDANQLHFAISNFLKTLHYIFYLYFR